MQEKLKGLLKIVIKEEIHRTAEYPEWNEDTTQRYVFQLVITTQLWNIRQVMHVLQLMQDTFAAVIADIIWRFRPVIELVREQVLAVVASTVRREVTG